MSLKFEMSCRVLCVSLQLTLSQEKTPKKWADNVSARVPLFWGETKSASLWRQLVVDTGVKCIVDLSPSTALATACMEMGVSYVGLSSSQVHMQWLVNTVDRASLQFICKAGSFLYQEELATHIRDLFADVVDPQDDKLGDEAIALTDDEGTD